MKILVVEDSPQLLRPIVSGLRHAGYDVEQAADGVTGLTLATTTPFDLIVLDIMLPRLDGLSLLRRLRAGNSPTRVLLLTAKDAIADRVAGLRDGADDYLVKPFAFDELLARVEAVLRRGRDLSGDALRVGPVRVDVASGQAFDAAGNALPLTPREFAILKYLAQNRGRVVSRTELEQRVYDDTVEPMSNVVDSAICTLRRKIDPPGEESLIVTRRGQGYIIQSGGE